MQVDNALIKAVARARNWFAEIKLGKVASMEEIAVREGFTPKYLARLLPLAFLAPDIVQLIAEGRQPPELTIASVTRGKPLPLGWADQRRMLHIT